jgi:hypothetical protein
VLLVFSFLFCNLGKLLLNIYDIGSLAKLRECTKVGLIFRQVAKTKTHNASDTTPIAKSGSTVL